MAIDSVPSCVQHGVAAADGTVKPYEHCAAFYTFASNQTFDAKTTSEFWLGASNGTLRAAQSGASPAAPPAPPPPAASA